MKIPNPEFEQGLSERPIIKARPHPGPPRGEGETGCRALAWRARRVSQRPAGYTSSFGFSTPGRTGILGFGIWRFGFLLSLAGFLCGPTQASPSNVQFNRDVRPILSDNCFTCHGPDTAAQKGGLRLDLRDLALKGGKSGDPAIVPGKPDESELLSRITTHDDNDRMPPPKSGKKLSGTQIQVLRQWILDGARYEAHWAFVSPQRPSVPEIASGRTEIDRFIRSRLNQEKLAPAPEADRRTLIRRLSFDLTGLPPTPEEVRAFLNDGSPDAYEKLVDRLLASPRYGEHMAAWWLDLARYADTSGFQGDPFRSMWRWRDWVIDAFNKNMPFDQFTIEQLAGDLLPNATMEQRLATGFNRNHRFNTEFGSIDEEWLVENVVDRVETTSATWLALTMGCARCHDHKYDPISQREFFEFFAFFNNIPERGVYWDGNDPAFAPRMRAPLPHDAARLKEFDRKIAEAEAELKRIGESLEQEQRAWENANRGLLKAILSSPHQENEAPAASLPGFPAGLVVHLPLDDSLHAVLGMDKKADVRAPEKLDFVPGALGAALKRSVDSEPIQISNVLEAPTATIALWVRPEQAYGVLFSKLGRQALFPLGIALSLTNGLLHFELNHQFYDFDATMVPLELTATEPLPLNEWTHVAVTLDGKRRDRGPTLFVNGRALPLQPKQASARGLPPFATQEPLLIGAGPNGAAFRGAVDDFRIYDRPLEEREIDLLARLPQALAFQTPAEERGPAERAKTCEFYRDFVSPAYAASRKAADDIHKARADFEKNLPLVMVMAEKPGPPTAHVLFRGQYDAPREQVGAAIPAALGKLPPESPVNRLGFAQWLVGAENPLTSRVLVNRLWERFFGEGLVGSSEDFGLQGDSPTHPELLDWLATELVRTGWDVKAMQKRVVMSDTYRQSSALTPELLPRDPENRLLARAPRLRLDAELIRDQALAVSGLLVERVGGPSVTPYLPGRAAKHTPDLYRRSVYSFWQRTRFNPSMATFDAPTREACTVKRPRTNTPLQALALLNEVTFVEAARVMAERVLKHPAGEEQRLRFGFELATGREPGEKELNVLRALLKRGLERYAADEEAATQLITHGASKPDAALNRVELAAYTLVASAILNLDEVVTKE
jgi:hypothetical protein